MDNLKNKTFRPLTRIIIQLQIEQEIALSS